MTGGENTDIGAFLQGQVFMVHHGDVEQALRKLKGHMIREGINPGKKKFFEKPSEKSHRRDVEIKKDTICLKAMLSYQNLTLFKSISGLQSQAKQMGKSIAKSLIKATNYKAKQLECLIFFICKGNQDIGPAKFLRHL